MIRVACTMRATLITTRVEYRRGIALQALLAAGQVRQALLLLRSSVKSPSCDALSLLLAAKASLRTGAGGAHQAVGLARCAPLVPIAPSPPPPSPMPTCLRAKQRGAQERQCLRKFLRLF